MSQGIPLAINAIIIKFISNNRFPILFKSRFYSRLIFKVQLSIEISVDSQLLCVDTQQLWVDTQHAYIT